MPSEQPIPFHNQRCGRCNFSAETHSFSRDCKEFVFKQEYYDHCKRIMEMILRESAERRSLGVDVIYAK